MRRHLKQIAPFRERGFLEVKTGTLPRLELVLSNHGAGGTSTEPAGLQSDFKDKHTGRRLRPAPGEGRGLSSERTSAWEAPFGSGGLLLIRPQLKGWEEELGPIRP